MKTGIGSRRNDRLALATLTRAVNQRGLATMILLPLLFVLLAFATVSLQMTNAGQRFSATQTARQKSFYIADGGIQSAMARLNQDRFTASTSSGYTTTGSGAIGIDSYAYTIIQDPMFPNDTTRKQITAVGSAAGSSATVVSQVQVFADDQGRLDNALCDWSIFADRGSARLVGGVAAATDLLNGNVHSNNALEVVSTVAAGLRGTGRFESVGAARSVASGALASTLAAELYRGGELSFGGAHVHAPLTGTPAFGIHFANGSGNHGVQQEVARLGFPAPDWTGIESDPTVTIVDSRSVPFGVWDQAADRWVVSGLRILPDRQSIRYYVRGGVRFENLSLAQSTNAMIAAEGPIEIDQLSLLQTNAGTILGVGLNTTQTLHLLSRKAVFVGRGLLQGESGALADLTRPGLNLSAGVAVRNRIAAYSQTGDVWVKSSSISALAATELNLVASNDSTYAVTGSIASTPRGYCQQL